MLFAKRWQSPSPKQTASIESALLSACQASAAAAEAGVPGRFRRGEQDGLLAVLATDPAAAMTIHDDVAVFGGAYTLLACRGRGGQSRLLRHRLRVAAEAGCGLVVATARPDSTSAANLRRAGFDLHRCLAWRRPRSGS